MRYTVFILISLLNVSCVTKHGPMKKVDAVDPRKRTVINEHVSQLAQDLVAQPVMTPRSGFSGYLAHFQVIRTTTKESPFAVIADGEGYTAADTPAELQDFADLKGAHPYGGTYAFSGSYKDSSSKDRTDNEARLVLEIPGPKGDGLMAIGFADGEVVTIKIPTGKLDDKTIQAILSENGRPLTNEEN